MLAEEDKNAEEKSLDGAWYKRKHNNSGKFYYLQNQVEIEKNLEGLIKVSLLCNSAQCWRHNQAFT